MEWPEERSTAQRPVRPEKSNSTNTAEPRAQAEIAMRHFNGKMPLEPYLVLIRLATLQNGWDRHKAALHLSLAPEGEVLQMLTNQVLCELQDIEKLVDGLQQSFG